MKLIGKRSAGKPHAAFDVAGTGNMTLKVNAPVLDPTCERLVVKFPRSTRPKIPYKSTPIIKAPFPLERVPS